MEPSQQRKSGEEDPQEQKWQCSVGNEAEVVGMAWIVEVVGVNQGDGGALKGVGVSSTGSGVTKFIPTNRRITQKKSRVR
ncbi:MAG TPA: hypothetical protein VLT62_25305 [Candidatus Methylomirabilis sp.]|nr:hypothetical protein [Candidatus Methylomirabilis sp.]